jgi:hypothetical protein
MKLFKKVIIRREDGTPYMIRRALNTPFFGVKLHHILLSDEDRDCHDHPWSFLSVILRGGYWEVTPEGGQPREIIEGKAITRYNDAKWYGAGSVLWRPAPWVHRLILPEGRDAWSLVFTGPRRREWGFHTVCGWIPWMKYWQKKREGC